MNSLDSTATGRWLIHSLGSVHVLDLDASTYERRPGLHGQRFPYDNTIVTLTRVEMWPRVGGRMLIWFDDPDARDLLEHFRLCSHIRMISRDTPHAESAVT